jgi:oxygen-independent coproporphyrinogen-3 oxidase
VRRVVPAAEFAAALADELAIRDLRGDALETLYLGGGTPSKLGGEGVARVIDAIRARYTLSGDAEVTVEANPEDVNTATVRAWRAAGVNRVSLGAQSFDDKVLAWMHRTHDAATIAAAVRAVRDEGIDNLSLDLIFALPSALGRDWERDVSAALALSADHVSVYGLTVEHATPLGRWTARGAVKETPEDAWASEFMVARDMLGAAGFEHYEVSNYARPGRRSRHNSAYWQDRAYIGVGPSAHGFDGASRRWNEPAYARWLERIGSGADPMAGTERLSDSERWAERVYVGLRTDEGLDLDALTAGEQAAVQRWIEAGWARVAVRHDSRKLVLTPDGWMRLDALAAALTSLRSH